MLDIKNLLSGLFSKQGSGMIEGKMGGPLAGNGETPGINPGVADYATKPPQTGMDWKSGLAGGLGALSKATQPQQAPTPIIPMTMPQQQQMTPEELNPVRQPMLSSRPRPFGRFR